MSGRTRNTLADGRRVVGYRKTLRQQSARTPPHEQPEMRLLFSVPAFMLMPANITAPTSEGPVEIGPLGNASITLRTWKREDLVKRAAAFMRQYTPKMHPPYTLGAAMTSSSEPRWKMEWQLAYVDGNVVVAQSWQAFIYPAAA